MTNSPSDFYEVISDIEGEAEGEVLSASFTPNNGIRVQIRNNEEGPSWAVFDFTDEQAEKIGHALVRWAQRRRAENEMIRCSRLFRGQDSTAE